MYYVKKVLSSHTPVGCKLQEKHKPLSSTVEAIRINKCQIASARHTDIPVAPNPAPDSWLYEDHRSELECSGGDNAVDIYPFTWFTICITLATRNSDNIAVPFMDSYCAVIFNKWHDCTLFISSRLHSSLLNTTRVHGYRGEDFPRKNNDEPCLATENMSSYGFVFL